MRLKVDLRKEKQTSTNAISSSDRLSKIVKTLTAENSQLQISNQSLEKEKKTLETKKRKLEADLAARVDPSKKAQKRKESSTPSSSAPPSAPPTQSSGHYLNIISSDILPSRISFTNGKLDE